MLHTISQRLSDAPRSPKGLAPSSRHMLAVILNATRTSAKRYPLGIPLGTGHKPVGNPAALRATGHSPKASLERMLRIPVSQSETMAHLRRTACDSRLCRKTTGGAGALRTRSRPGLLKADTAAKQRPSAFASQMSDAESIAPAHRTFALL